MIFPKFCKNCIYSVPEKNSEWNLRCIHPIVNAKDEWALSSGTSIRGSSCVTERKKTSWFAKCGMRGRLYELKFPEILCES